MCLCTLSHYPLTCWWIIKLIHLPMKYCWGISLGWNTKACGYTCRSAMTGSDSDCDFQKHTYWFPQYQRCFTHASHRNGQEFLFPLLAFVAAATAIVIVLVLANNHSHWDNKESRHYFNLPFLIVGVKGDGGQQENMTHWTDWAGLTWTHRGCNGKPGAHNRSAPGPLRTCYGS